METGHKNQETDIPHTLQILDEVAKGKPFTQRDLSRKLGIALGMTNNYLKRLVRDGYLKIVRAEGKRLHYFLTPMGIAERSALTYRYIKKSYQIFSTAREKMTRFFDDLENEGVKSVVLYKATVVAEIAVLGLQDTLLDLVAIVDDRRVGGRFLGYKIKAVEDLRWLNFDRLLLTTEESPNQVEKDLEPYGIEKEKICSLK